MKGTRCPLRKQPCFSSRMTVPFFICFRLFSFRIRRSLSTGWLLGPCRNPCRDPRHLAIRSLHAGHVWLRTPVRSAAQVSDDPCYSDEQRLLRFRSASRHCGRRLLRKSNRSKCVAGNRQRHALPSQWNILILPKFRCPRVVALASGWERREDRGDHLPRVHAIVHSIAYGIHAHHP